MFGQMGHFRVYAKDKIPYAIDRYTNESKRLLGVLEERLKDRQYIMGGVHQGCWVQGREEGIALSSLAACHTLKIVSLSGGGKSLAVLPCLH